MRVHPGSDREPLQIIISLGTKFNMTFLIVSLKTDTCSLTFKSMSADSQSKKVNCSFYMIRVCFGKMLHSLVRRWVKNF